MKKLALIAALALPLTALAAPPEPPHGRGPGAPEEGVRRAHMEKRMRMARTLGLAEALDLGEAEALRMRDALAAFDGRTAPLRAQLRDSLELVRRAARGDAAAQKGLDEALKRLREAGDQLRAAKEELFQSLTRDLSAERKARAALFLRRFEQRMGGLGREGKMGPGPRPGMGPGMGKGGPRWGMSGQGGGEPGDELLGDDELM